MEVLKNRVGGLLNVGVSSYSSLEAHRPLNEREGTYETLIDNPFRPLFAHGQRGTRISAPNNRIAVYHRPPVRLTSMQVGDGLGSLHRD